MAVLFKKGSLMLNIDEQKLKMIKRQLKEEFYQPKNVVRYLEKEINQARKVYPLTTILKIFNKTFHTEITYSNFQKTLYRTQEQRKKEEFEEYLKLDIPF